MNYLWWCTGFALGNFILQQLPQLLTFYSMLAITLIAIVVCWFTLRRLPSMSSLFCGALLGFLWAWGFAHYYVSQQLPKELIQKNVEVVGQITTIPQKYAHHTVFNFRVQSLSYEGKNYSAPVYIRLSWYADRYAKNPLPLPTLKVGQTWRFVARLKPLHGFASPGAQDYSQQLFAQHLGAVGYIVTREQPTLLSEEINGRDIVNHLRENLWEQLQQVLEQQAQAGIIAALALGEKTNITQEEWKVLQTTGTSHLVAISGLHVGLVAGLALMAMRAIGKQISPFTRRYPVMILGSAFGLLVAIFYSALAGFAVPTQRAIIMLALVMYGLFTRRAFARIYTFASAVILVLLWDPLAMLSLSFWLSFIAVGTLFYLMSGKHLRAKKIGSRGYEWCYLQVGISILLIPITLWFFQQAPLVSPLANAIAIPWVSFIVVPLTLAGCLFLYLSSAFGTFLLQLAIYSMQVVWYLLAWFADWPYANWQYTLAHPAILICLILAVVILFVPRGLPGRAYSVVGLLPLWWLAPSQPAEGEVWLDILDVGQGLAAIVRTAEHTLIYDTGDSFSERLNAGSAVILPFLRTQGISAIDVMVISHANKDHTGGAETILQQMEVKNIYSGDNWQTNDVKVNPCIAGQHWEWEGVIFTMLHPAAQEVDKWQDNNASCVLKISSGPHSALLTGDLESAGEKSLLLLQTDQLSSNILIAPHHGSRSSSTVKFIRQVNPEYVIFPAGYLNRFNFPNSLIVERYLQHGALALTTASHGTIHLAFDEFRLAEPDKYRDKYRRYWHNSFK